jgi:hypothetical protein
MEYSHVGSFFQDVKSQTVILNVVVAAAVRVILLLLLLLFYPLCLLLSYQKHFTL